MAIDTLKVARRLREAGFSEPQAEALVAAVREGAEAAELATKADLATIGSELRAEIAALRSEMRETEQRLVARMEAMKAEIMRSTMTMILTAVLVNVVTVLGAMFAAVALLGH
jgi:DNA-binding transcriptional MerR regulator